MLNTRGCLLAEGARKSKLFEAVGENCSQSDQTGNDFSDHTKFAYQRVLNLRLAKGGEFGGAA